MSSRKDIIVFDAKKYDREFISMANEEFGYEISFIEDKLSLNTVALAQGVTSVCAFVNDDLSAPVIEALSDGGTKLVAMRCAGYNNVDLNAAYGRIHVARVPAYSPHAVAEHTIALILTLNRQIHRSYFRTHDRNFRIDGLLGFDMYGKTAGVVGTGKIGKNVAQLLSAFGMRVLAYDVFPDKEWAAKYNVEYVELDAIYSLSDIITLHCPLTAENTHMICAETIALMKPGVMLVNTGRGKLISTPDLINALKSKKIGSAALDVYEEEDRYFFEDFSSEIVQDDVLARLLTFPNVLVTSHQAYFTREALNAIADITLNNIRQFMKGEHLENEVCYRCGLENCAKETTGSCF